MELEIQKLFLEVFNVPQGVVNLCSAPSIFFIGVDNFLGKNSWHQKETYLKGK